MLYDNCNSFFVICLAMKYLCVTYGVYYWPAEHQYSNLDDIRMALEDGEIQGALIDTYVIAEHKESLLSDRIFVKKILDRPFGYGVVLSGAARNVELRCRDYIHMKITDIFQIIQNTTKTLDVSFLVVIDCYRLLQTLIYESLYAPGQKKKNTHILPKSYIKEKQMTQKR